MKIEDRIVNESLTVLTRLKDDVEALLVSLEARRAELIELLEDKARSRDCVYWKGHHPGGRWGSCLDKRFDQPCDGDSAACKVTGKPKGD